MAISMKRILTKDEIRAQLEIWFKYRDGMDYDFRLHTGVNDFNVTPERVTKFERIED